MYKAKNQFIHSGLGVVKKDQKLPKNPETTSLFEQGYLVEITANKKQPTLKSKQRGK